MKRFFPQLINHSSSSPDHPHQLESLYGQITFPLGVLCLNGIVNVCMYEVQWCLSTQPYSSWRDVWTLYNPLISGIFGLRGIGYPAAKMVSSQVHTEKEAHPHGASYVCTQRVDDFRTTAHTPP
ncbi:hypothetical protein PGT21_029780 [Puccinia graminis f. sp. tritici]|uniref:Uncharacterized protein n=1 Tax=Puccinia graminis f. sp. tritici TaxID=56615 RepID=A0A5B0PVB4_PUCGR|nr:hypothetical protein PGT21_029780 [Puccinia graminis f. sp. tritici]